MDDQKHKKWEPDLNNVQELVSIFQLSSASDNQTHQIIFQKLINAEKHPEYPCYLSYIMVKMPNITNDVRYKAGLTLKNVFHKKNSSIFPPDKPELLYYVQDSLLKLIRNGQPLLQDIASYATECILNLTHLSHWPQLLPTIIEGLKSKTQYSLYQRGSLKTLAVITPTLWNQNEYSVYDKELNQLLSSVLGVLEKMISFQDNYSLNTPTDVNNYLIMINLCIEIFVKHAQYKSKFFETTPSAIELVCKICNCDAPIVKNSTKPAEPMIKLLLTNICAFFESLLYYSSAKIPQLYSKMNEFVLTIMSKRDDQYFITACDYFCTYCTTSGTFGEQNLSNRLPKLAELLFDNISYDDSLCLVISEQQDSVQNDINQKNLNFMTQSDQSKEWNKRKSAANTFDHLFKRLGPAFLLNFLPAVMTNLAEVKNPQNWKSVESSVLVLGITIDNNIVHNDDLKHVIKVFVNILINSDQFLVKSTTLWAISKCSSFCYENYTEDFIKTLINLITKSMTSPYIKLQQSSCTALDIFISTAKNLDSMKINDLTKSIFQIILICSDDYKSHESLRLCYDALGTLIGYISLSMGEEEIRNFVAKPLMERFGKMSDCDYRVMMMCDIVYCLLLHSSKTFKNLAEDFFPKIFIIFGNHFNNIEKNISSNSYLFIVKILDFFVNIFITINKSCENILNERIMEMAFYSSKCGDHSVKQVAFVLVGTIAQNCSAKFKPALDNFVFNCVEGLDPSDYILFNNSNWCLGQICLVRKESVKMYIDKIMTKQIIILDNPDDYRNRILLPNVTTTIGIICLSFPAECANELSKFGKKWLKRIGEYPFEDESKRYCLEGLIGLIKINPEAFLFCFGELMCILCAFDDVFGLKDIGLQVRF